MRNWWILVGWLLAMWLLPPKVRAQAWGGSQPCIWSGSFTECLPSTGILLRNQRTTRYSELTTNGANFVAITAPASLASDFTMTLPAATDTFVGKATTDTLTNKTMDGGSNTFTNLPATGLTGTVPIANGGTGQATKAPAFDALQPMTTAGDIIYGGASGTGTRLAIGVNGQKLRAGATNPGYGWNSINSVIASYAILDTDGYDVIQVTTASTLRTVTLPAAANNSGREIIIKKVDNGTGAVAISGTIDGGTTNNTILYQYGLGTVYSDGSAWHWKVDIQDSGTFTSTFPAAGAPFSTDQGITTLFRRNGRTINITMGGVSAAANGGVRTSADAAAGTLPINPVTSPRNYIIEIKSAGVVQAAGGWCQFSTDGSITIRRDGTSTAWGITSTNGWTSFSMSYPIAL